MEYEDRLNVNTRSQGQKSVVPRPWTKTALRRIASPLTVKTTMYV